MATLVGTLLHWDWHPDHSGYSGASLPANGPDPAATTGTFLSLVFSWCRQLARVPWPGKEQEPLLISLPFPLSFLSLTLPIFPHFVFLVPRSWTQVSCRRASAWAEDWRLITSSWQRTQILVSGRAKFQSSLLWRPRVKSHNAWVSAGGRRRLWGHPFCPPFPSPPASSFNLASFPPFEIFEDLRYFPLLC